MNLLNELKENRKNYKDMIDYCCDSLILNNDLMQELEKRGCLFDLYCGDILDYEDNNGNLISREKAETLDLCDYTEIYKDFYQYYLISEQDAERLAEYTNETVFYNSDLDLYLLAVDHFGTYWGGVPANWKNEEAEV